MAFMMRAIDEAKKHSGFPELEHGVFTSFPDGK
jgi:hypothetical protein